ncbi:M1 family metallopeptidase [Rubrolithibacter danxiaensis]|uniref:M1 family metallopeptidase n=1 Tax=Rubrolithibacter danxiaensis TaxID=3390805 RepID=UPI003BF8C981
MKKISAFILIAFLCFTVTIQAQQLYMPRNIKAAYKSGTRSADGKPGKNYWQNHGKYVMDITVNAQTKVVSGTEKISYTNNSPDTLKSLVIRFVNNIHKPESPRSGQTSADFLTTGLDITSFSVAGEPYSVNSEDWGTVGIVKLKKPVLPGTTTDVNISWNYPLSKQSGREGQIDSTTFYVAYSYPRISVYDDYNGWDLIPHSDRQEFYNDFNDYVYSVKAPKNYIVWGTGDFLNPDEVLQPKFAERLKKSYTADDIIHIATAQEMKNGEVTKQNDWNTWKFSVNNISDVCFALSNHYLWDASSVVVDSKTKRRASTQAAYDEKAKDFTGSVSWSNKALAWFSTHWPGVPYPYSKMIAFQGFADMEYPMMVNDSSTPDPQFSQFVQNHEIAHTYFPFYMGINETRYAYMDEGWATTLEYLIGIDQIGKEAAINAYQNFRVKRWIFDPSAEEDQPIISMSTQVSGAGYGNNAYVKASLSYLALKDLLGDELFKKALHVYMDNWNGKHPIPWDYFNSMNSGSGQNLNWFFNNWFFSNNYIDLAVEKVSGNSITVKNIGGFAVPFDVKIEYTDGSKESLHQTPAIWKTNSKSAIIALKSSKKIASVSLDGAIFMDANPKDNSWKK